MPSKILKLDFDNGSYGERKKKKPGLLLSK
jgi:hypothetical protein